MKLILNGTAGWKFGQRNLPMKSLEDEDEDGAHPTDEVVRTNKIRAHVPERETIMAGCRDDADAQR